MDISEAYKSRIEEQILIDVSDDQIGGYSATPFRGDNTESVPEFLTNLRLSEHFAPPREDVEMTPEVFSGISNGNKECLETLRSDATSMARLKNNRGDSILHLAATWGHAELVKEIVCECPRLLLEPNSTGQTPLHVAARGGHTAVVDAFVALVTYASARLCTKESERVLNSYVLKDEDGNTPLHLAIKGRYMKIASCLVKANKDASFLGNNKGKSSLYMAVKSKDESLVKAILETTSNEDFQGRERNLLSKLQGRKYLVHVALKAESIVILDIILNEYPTLMKERDRKGRTCLSLAAAIGNYKGVHKLLDRSRESVYVCDADGSFPIHTAATQNSPHIVEYILERCPDSKHLLNKLGQNVLHIAAKEGKFWTSNSLMKNKDTKHLVVGQDVDGNTPLHLAVINWHYRSIICLAKSREIQKIRNKGGLRARDIAELELRGNYIFKERWTLALILYAMHSRGDKSVDSLTRPSVPTDPKNDRDYVNTLLLVATLVATVTFAAGFTIPGGFNSSAPHLGRATLATNPTLFIFLLLDILAMHSSVAAICTLIWAQLGDPELILSSLKVALPLLLFALLCMPLAFLFVVIIAVGHVKWLLSIICYISIVFFCWAIFVLGPHVMLQGSYVPPKYVGGFLVTFMQYKGMFESVVFWIKVIFSKLVLRDQGIFRIRCGSKSYVREVYWNRYFR